MVLPVTPPTEDDEIARSFVANAGVGPMMDFKRPALRTQRALVARAIFRRLSR